MALKIRLQRQGTKNLPVFRIVVIASTRAVRGLANEILGHYNPRARKSDPKIKLNIERYNYWISVGAQPSDTVKSLARTASTAEAKDGVCIVLPAAIAAPVASV
jgi:small subunit ribosomal protein S16